MSFEMNAKFAGRCPICGRRYPAGTLITKRDDVWQHVSCDQPVQDRNYPFSAETPLRASGGPGKLSGAALMSAVTVAEEVRDAAADPLSAEPAAPFVPSAYQVAFFAELLNGTGHLVVEAGPGSGKTTTIVQGMRLLPRDLDVCLLAFNKHIAVEIGRRVPDARVSTIHSLGYSLIRRAVHGVEIDKDKTGTLLDPYYPVSFKKEPSSAKRRENRAKRLAMRKLVSIAKATMFDYRNATPSDVADLVARYGIDADDEVLDELTGLLPTVMDAAWMQREVIDYDDMIWLPLVLGIKFDHFDYLFVDEAQDLNRSQIEFIVRSVKGPLGRIVAVGDRHQSLYAFRGADAEAIPNLIERLHAKVLPLSISYRCPTSHLAKVNTIKGTKVEAAPGAKEGLIGEIREIDLTEFVQAGDLVLCRNNAPLVDPAFACVRRDKKAVIRGRDIGEDLIALVERFHADTLEALRVSLEEWYRREYQHKLEKGKELEAENLTDKVKTLEYVMSECLEVGQVISKLRTIFSDETVGVIFSSVHRAKGLEAERVFILKEELMPSRRASEPWELEQELNVMYVAYSRSKSELYFVR